MEKIAYQPHTFEHIWQEYWKETGQNQASESNGKPKFYNLTMFPYPSGDLHIGHWSVYVPVDAYGRFKKMQGYNVMQPFGFDAFGLPAENAAIKRNMQACDWTLSNVEVMRKQLKTMGAQWDWDREVITCLPEYYKWTQWIFLQFYKHGMVYREKRPANWCTGCQTVIANEQIEAGKDTCDRCHSPVIQKEIAQWMFRMTDYAEELLRFDGIDWPAKTKTMQTNWIGRSEGAEIQFFTEKEGKKQYIPVFTTRPDTLFGVTFFVLAPEHPMVDVLTTPEQYEAIQQYREQTRSKTELDRISAEHTKTGVFTGGFVTNPVNGEQVPVWISDYVLMSYGTGAVMGVPAHDQRDFVFAKKFGLPIREVVHLDEEKDGNDPAQWESAHEATGMLIQSGDFTGMENVEAKSAIIAFLEAKGIGKRKITYRLRDWSVSRQRYWGCPIPIIYCPKDGAVPVSEEALPVVLPEHIKIKLTGSSPLLDDPDFIHAACPICGGEAMREADTLDTFICSSWYFLRYADPHNQEQAWSQEEMQRWLPVNMYIGGAEHATMHLLYARYFVKALRDMGHLSFDEPFLQLRHQGMIYGPDGYKMSKSRGNVVSPDEEVEKYSVDAVRCAILFLKPFDADGVFKYESLEGVSRFLQRFCNVLQDTWQDGTERIGGTASAEAQEIERVCHKTIQRVTDDITALHFNTALSALMECNNELIRLQHSGIAHSMEYQKTLKTMVLLLAPMAPHIAEELWHRMGNEGSVHLESWPVYDEELLVDDTMTIAIQIQGKLRDQIVVSTSTTEEEIRTLVLSRPKVLHWLGGKEPRKVIYVPGKIMNFVL